MRVKRSIRDRGAIAAVVGTIMSLIVFLAFMSLFTTQYVPVWMAENEAQHTDTVLSEFGSLRQNMDLLILSNDQETSAFSTMTLGSKGVPVFAAPTLGIFTIAPLEENFTGDQDNASAGLMLVEYFDTGLNTTNTVAGAGRVELYSPNRYHVQQWVSFEGGGIILNQTDGEWMRAGPSMRIEKRDTGNGSVLNVSFRSLSVVGKRFTKTGAQTIGVKEQLMNQIQPDIQMYGGTPRSVNITLYTYHKSAWRDWFNRTLSDAGLIPGTDYVIDDSANYRIRMTLSDLVYFSISEAVFKMDAGEVV